MKSSKRTRGVWGGGACLSLALLSVAYAQDDADAPEPEEAPQVLPADAVVVEGGNGTVQFRAVVVQDGDAAIDIEDEILAQLIKQLQQQGIPMEDINDMLGVEHSEPRSAIDEGNDVVAEAEDGGALYLPLGTTQKFTLEAGTTLELPFVADGAGLLTVAYGGGGPSAAIELVDHRGRRLDWESSRSYGIQVESPVRHALIPIGTEGEYTVRVGVRQDSELVLGAEWLPFPQVEGVEAVIVPAPEPTTEVVLVPDRMVEGQIDQSDPDRYHLWCRFDATEDGQLVVLASADRGDITISSFHEGRYESPIEHLDSDLNGSVANEGLIVDVQAGQTYYVRVEMRSGSRCGVEVRTGWVPMPTAE